jgi:hypothetical protein
MLYATTDSDAGRIEKDASIFAFDTMDEVRDYLLRGYDAAEWDLDTAEIGAGDFSDCWIKALNAPAEEDGKLIVGACDCAPFTAAQLTVRGPGQHPGGRAWWIEPTEPVLVLTSIKERA